MYTNVFMYQGNGAVSAIYMYHVYKLCYLVEHYGWVFIVLQIKNGFRTPEWDKNVTLRFTDIARHGLFYLNFLVKCKFNTIF